MGRSTEKPKVAETNNPHIKQANEKMYSCVTWFFHYVGDSTGTILPVLKGDFSFARAFYCNRQTASTCLSGPDTELS